MFCHNDLSQQNVIVNPESLKILAIIDWEYAGFYPEYFDRPFYKRLGPSMALDGEEDDTEKCLDFLRSHLVCTTILFQATLTTADNFVLGIVGSSRNTVAVCAVNGQHSVQKHNGYPSSVHRFATITKALIRTYCTWSAR